MKIKNEQVFLALSPIRVEPNEEGRKQFFEQQSFGKMPVKPHPYFECLVRGKWEADRLTTDYRTAFFSPIMGDWCGLLQFWKDWEGRRFVLPYILSWHKKPKIKPETINTFKDWLNQYIDDLPEWIEKEISIEQLREEYKVSC